MITTPRSRFSYRPADGPVECEIQFHDRLPPRWECHALRGFRRVLLVADGRLRLDEREAVQAALVRHGLTVEALLLRRVGAKDHRMLLRIWDAAVRHTPDCIVGIGGGTVCDLVGLAAATYQRGVPRLLFPSTLLGMVDACIGGKTAIDHGSVKNSIGATHYPCLSVNLLSFLETLPAAEFRAGLAEVVKAAVIASPDLFSRLCGVFRSGRSPAPDALLPLLMESARIKARVCEQQDADAKLQLLYGHAVGHALESIAKGELRHGECVAIGMSLEGAVACMQGLWSEDEWSAQQVLLANIGLPVSLPAGTSIHSLIARMRLYKKLVSEQTFRLIVPSQIGSISNPSSGYGIDVPHNQMSACIKSAIKWANRHSNVSKVDTP